MLSQVPPIYILEAVCARYRVRLDVLRASARPVEIIKPRRVAARLLRDAGLSLLQIGRAMHRDHTSVRHMLEDERLGGAWAGEIAELRREVEAAPLHYCPTCGQRVA